MRNLVVAALVFGLLGCRTDTASSGVKDQTASLAPSAAGQVFAYGNAHGARAPAAGDPGALLNPSNDGLNPRVVDAQHNDATFPLKATGAPLFYGDGQPMKNAQGTVVKASDAVFLNYGMRKERDGHTFFMAWQTNRGLPQALGGSSTGWVAASDMADGGAAALAAVPHRLGNVPQPLAKGANGAPLTFVVNGSNQGAQEAAALDLKYKGFHGHMDRVINFFNLHSGAAGIQMLMNLTNVPGGGIGEDCLPNGTKFLAAGDAGAGNHAIEVTVPVSDKNGVQRPLVFIYGNAGDTWGWVVKSWLDPVAD